MSPFLSVVMQPFIQIGLWRVDAIVELLTKRDFMELMQNCYVDPFACPVRLDDSHLLLPKSE